MATQEDQRQLVVGYRPRPRGLVRRLMLTYCRLLLLQALHLPPLPIQRLVPSGADQPRARVRGNPAGSPLDDRCRTCLLNRILCHLEVADEPGHSGHGRPPMSAEHRIQIVAQLRTSTFITGITGRTSTDPDRAAGMVAAQRSASSRS